VIDTYIRHTGEQVSHFLGKKEAYGFEDGELDSAVLNRPTTCAAKDTSVFLADARNHRLREARGLHLECLYNRHYENLINATAEYHMRLQDLIARCEEVDDRFVDAVNTFFSGDGTTEEEFDELMQNYVCIDTAKNDGSCPAGVLKPGGSITQEKINQCECRREFNKLIMEPVFFDCPADKALNDKWHRLGSLLLRCLVQQMREDKQTNTYLPAKYYDYALIAQKEVEIVDGSAIDLKTPGWFSEDTIALYALDDALDELDDIMGLGDDDDFGGGFR
jgi:hypothetical protein